MTAGILKMQHDTDPREELQKRAGDLAGMEVMHNALLVAIYVRPERTAGGIALPGQTRKEDEFQGKVGLVLKKGPLAFVDDERNKFHGADVSVGDWVSFRVQDGWTLTLPGTDKALPCRMLEDVHIKMKLDGPDAVY